MFPVPPTGPGYYSLLDVIRGNCRKDPPKYPYPRFGLMQPSFFDADFALPGRPEEHRTRLFDPLKRIRLGDDWLFSTGGQAWTRYQNEYNCRLAQRDNNYHLTRPRLYADLWYQDHFRAVRRGHLRRTPQWQDLPPLPIDEHRRRLPEPVRRR